MCGSPQLLLEKNEIKLIFLPHLSSLTGGDSHNSRYTKKIIIILKVTIYNNFILYTKLLEADFAKQAGQVKIHFFIFISG